MNPILPTEYNALYAAAAAGTDFSTAAASVQEVQGLVSEICASNPKEVNTNKLLQRAIEVATRQVELAKAKYDLAAKLASNDAQAVIDAKNAVSLADQALKAANDQLTADQNAYNLLVNTTIPNLENTMIENTKQKARTEYQFVYDTARLNCVGDDLKAIVDLKSVYLDDPIYTYDDKMRMATSYVQNYKDNPILFPNLNNVLDAYSVAALVENSTIGTIQSDLLQAQFLVSAAETVVQAKDTALTAAQTAYENASTAMSEINLGGLTPEQYLANLDGQIAPLQIHYDATLKSQQLCANNSYWLDSEIQQVLIDNGYTKESYLQYLDQVVITNPEIVDLRGLAFLSPANPVSQAFWNDHDLILKIEPVVKGYINYTKGLNYYKNRLVPLQTQRTIVDNYIKADQAYTIAAYEYNVAVRHYNALDNVFDPINEAYITAFGNVSQAEEDATQLIDVTIPADNQAVTNAQDALNAANAVDINALEAKAAASAAAAARAKRFWENKVRVLGLLKDLAERHSSLYSGGSKYLPKGRSIPDIRSRI